MNKDIGNEIGNDIEEKVKEIPDHIWQDVLKNWNDREKLIDIELPKLEKTIYHLSRKDDSGNILFYIGKEYFFKDDEEKEFDCNERMAIFIEKYVNNNISNLIHYEHSFLEDNNGSCYENYIKDKNFFLQSLYSSEFVMKNINQDFESIFKENDPKKINDILYEVKNLGIQFLKKQAKDSEQYKKIIEEKNIIKKNRKNLFWVTETVLESEDIEKQTFGNLTDIQYVLDEEGITSNFIVTKTRIFTGIYGFEKSSIDLGDKEYKEILDVENKNRMEWEIKYNVKKADCPNTNTASPTGKRKAIKKKF